MNDNFTNPEDDFLENALSAMRKRIVPDGPSDIRMNQTIAALSAAANLKPHFFRRITTMKFITGMAASVVLVIGAGVVAILMLKSPEMTVADVVQTVRNAHTMSFVITTPATPKTPQTLMKMLINDQGQMSMEMPGGSRMVMNMKTGHMTMLETKMKTAVLMDMKNMPKRSREPKDLIESFKNLQGKSAKDLGKTEIDGKTAEEFTATQNQMDYTVWADPQSHEPIRVDIAQNVMDQKWIVSMTDFDFNPIVPVDAFNADVPPGYTVQKINLVLPNMDNPEQNVIDLLREYAQRSAGKFPEKLDDLSLYMKVAMQGATTRSANIDDAGMRLIVGSQAVKYFLGKLPKGDWKYTGSGKSLGDGSAIIFWYKSPKHYRAVYGDLTAKDLPAKPQ